MESLKRIAWITPRCFVETDIYAIELLIGKFNINWFIVESSHCNEYNDKIEELRAKGVNIKKIYIPGRNRSIKTLLFYYKFLLSLKKANYDMVYNAIFGMPFYMPLESLLIPKRKIVIALHNVTTPIGAKAGKISSKLYTWFVSHVFSNYHTFSASQCKILKSINKTANVFEIPFALKDYGVPDEQKSDIITFLFFGQILEYKRLDILIKAADNLYDKLHIAFKVKIAGSCPYWHRYDSLIRNKELFDISIRRIENDEIPNLFSSSHYFVMPYQDIAQSGAIIVAINYKLPVIVSSLPSFLEHIKDNYNGFIIRPANQEDLEKTMEYILINNNDIYEKLSSNMLEYRRHNFMPNIICDKYLSEFIKIINNKK